MLKEDEYNYWWAPCDSIWLQVMFWNTEAGIQNYARESGEGKCAGTYMEWQTISWEACKIDTTSYMIDCYWQLWYQMQKLPQQQQLSLIGWVCQVIHEGLGLLECKGKQQYCEYHRWPEYS